MGKTLKVKALICLALILGGLVIAPAAEAADAPVQTSVAPDYLIGPGDTLEVFVWRNEDLSVTVPVRPDGKISTPLVEDMSAVGKTTSRSRGTSKNHCQNMSNRPQVNVVVTIP